MSNIWRAGLLGRALEWFEGLGEGLWGWIGVGLGRGRGFAVGLGGGEVDRLGFWTGFAVGGRGVEGLYGDGTVAVAGRTAGSTGGGFWSMGGGGFWVTGCGW